MLKLTYKHDVNDEELLQSWLVQYSEDIILETLKEIKTSIKDNTDDIEIVEVLGQQIENEDNKITINLNRESYVTWLTDNTQWFIDTDRFENVVEINNLIKTLSERLT